MMTRLARLARWWLRAMLGAGALVVGGCGGGRRTGDAALADLPLVEVPTPVRGRLFAVLMSGDGGWAPGDRGLAAALAARGVPVVGLSSPRYLLHARTPDQSARDLTRIVDHYLQIWGRDSVIVIGYSRGADVVPFMVSRLSPALRSRVALVALLGPSQWAGLQFHPIDLVRNVHRAGDLPVAPEIERLRGTPVLCLYGRRDLDTICPSLDSSLVRRVVRAGGHEVSGREGPVMAETILTAALGARRSALGARRSALGARRSAVGCRRV